MLAPPEEQPPQPLAAGRRAPPVAGPSRGLDTVTVVAFDRRGIAGSDGRAVQVAVPPVGIVGNGARERGQVGEVLRGEFGPVARPGEHADLLAALPHPLRVAERAANRETLDEVVERLVRPARRVGRHAEDVQRVAADAPSRPVGQFRDLRQRRIRQPGRQRVVAPAGVGARRRSPQPRRLDRPVRRVAERQPPLVRAERLAVVAAPLPDRAELPPEPRPVGPRHAVDQQRRLVGLLRPAEVGNRQGGIAQGLAQAQEQPGLRLARLLGGWQAPSFSSAASNRAIAVALAPCPRARSPDRSRYSAALRLDPPRP